jgi:hypothetical protein
MSWRKAEGGKAAARCQQEYRYTKLNTPLILVLYYNNISIGYTQTGMSIANDNDARGAESGDDAVGHMSIDM